MTDEDGVQKTVLDYFRSKGELPGATREEILSFAYLDEGYIDSMGIIELVMTLEQECGIQLGPDQLQSDEFRTIGGVIDIVRQLRSGATG